MFESIKGKRVLISGASGGLGLKMAELFAKNGAVLGLHYHSNRDALEKAFSSDSDSVTFLQADLTNQKEVKELVERFVKEYGGIDVLINNAGAAHEYTHFSEVTDEVLKESFALNAFAPFYLMREVFPLMQAKGGRIINISSVNVKYGGSAKSLHYSAAKGALESFARGFARAGAEYNILVNTIRSGFIDTPMRNRVKGYTQADTKRRIELIPLKRMGVPEDIARMALFLSSEGGDFITGEVLTVAGGD